MLVSATVDLDSHTTLIDREMVHKNPQTVLTDRHCLCTTVTHNLLDRELAHRKYTHPPDLASVL